MENAEKLQRLTKAELIWVIQELARLHDDLGHRDLDGAECDGAGPGGPEEGRNPYRGTDGSVWRGRRMILFV